MQGNETTWGYEGGCNARLADGRIDLTIAGFDGMNRDILRRHPLCGDPQPEANHPQPQFGTDREVALTYRIDF